MNSRSPAAARPISRAALYEEVAERLRARIFARELSPGGWVDEQALADEFGISRTPLREALKVLAAEGLVMLKPRRGCYVTELAERDLDEVFPVMALLEGRCALEATDRATAADIQRLERLHRELERHAAGGDADLFFEVNQAFHDALRDIGGNRWLNHLIDDTRKMIRLSRRDSLRLEGRIKESLREHRAILAAIRARDPNRAAREMHDHLIAGRRAVAKLQSGK